MNRRLKGKHYFSESKTDRQFSNYDGLTLLQCKSEKYYSQRVKKCILICDKIDEFSETQMRLKIRMGSRDAGLKLSSDKFIAYRSSDPHKVRIIFLGEVNEVSTKRMAFLSAPRSNRRD